MSRKFKLMPLSGKLLPPSDGGSLLNVGTASEEALSDQFNRAGAEARELISRATHLAAEKAPEIKKKAENLASTARITLADSQKRKAFMESNRKKIVIGVAATFMLAGGGWMFAKHQATAIAKDRIGAFFIRSGLSSNITYEDISASPFGSVTLSGVMIRAPDGAVFAKIGSIGLSDIEIKGGRLLGLKVMANSFEVPLLALARSRWRLSMAVDAIGMGYTTLNGNFSFAGRRDDLRQTLSIETNGDIRNMGNMEAKIRLGNIDLDAIAIQFTMSQATQENNPLVILMSSLLDAQSFARATLEKADVTIDNGGYFKRTHEITASDMPPDTTPTAPAGNARAGATAEIDKLVRAGLLPSDATATLAALENWTARGGRLRVSTNINPYDPPFPVAALWGGMTAPDNLMAFLAATHATVSN